MISVLRFTHHHSHFVFLSFCLTVIAYGTSWNAPANVAPQASRNGFTSTVIFQSWRLSPSEPKKREGRLAQIALPLFLQRRFSSNAWLSISQSIASMHFDDGDIDESVSGLGDTTLRFAYEFPNGHVRLSTGLSLPTGKNRLSPLEVEVANQFYSEVLAFHVNRLGEGVDLHLSAAVVKPIASLILSGGASYLRKGGYEVMQSAPQYNPGDQFQVVVAASLIRNRIGWQSTLTYMAYAADRFDSRIWFDQGDELLIDSAVQWSGWTTQFELMHREFLRGRNRFRSTTDVLSTEILNTNGNRRELALRANYRTSPLVEIYGEVEYQSTQANEKKVGSSTIWEYTMGLDLQLTDGIKMQVGGRLATGEMRDASVDLRGLGTWVSVSSGRLR